MRNRFCVALVLSLPLTAFVAGSAGCLAQDSDFNLNVHANSHATAEKVGLPVYPGAKIYKDKDDSSADLGLAFGDFHFSLLAVKYETGDPAAKVLEFYRKPLSHYGEVLECLHGKPLGDRTKTNSGLTCSSEQGDHLQVNGSPDSSKDHELRAGTPLKFRIVGIDSSDGGNTRFGLVYLELPKDDKAK
jgi:hypothetical protein